MNLNPFRSNADDGPVDDGLQPPATTPTGQPTRSSAVRILAADEVAATDTAEAGANHPSDDAGMTTVLVDDDRPRADENADTAEVEVEVEVNKMGTPPNADALIQIGSGAPRGAELNPPSLDRDGNPQNHFPLPRLEQNVREYRRQQRVWSRSGSRIGRPLKKKALIVVPLFLVVVAAGFGAWWFLVRDASGTGSAPSADTSAVSRPDAFSSGASAIVEALTAPPPTASPLPVPPPAEAPVIARVETAEPVVFITIDDGYRGDAAVLDILRSRNAPVTAFPVADKALDTKPDFWKQIEALGGTVENHSMSHANMARMSPEQQTAELCGASDRIESVLGRRPTIARIPFGSYSAEAGQIAAGCGVHVLVHWTLEIRDKAWIMAPGKPGLEAGDIVLLHFKPALAEELGILFAEMDTKGLTAANLTDYIGPDAKSA